MRLTCDLCGEFIPYEEVGYDIVCYEHEGLDRAMMSCERCIVDVSPQYILREFLVVDDG